MGVIAPPHLSSVDVFPRRIWHLPSYALHNCDMMWIACYAMQVFPMSTRNDIILHDPIKMKEEGSLDATTGLLMKIWSPGGLWCAVYIVASLGLCRPPGYSINPDQLLSGYQEQRLRWRSLTSPVFSLQSSVLQTEATLKLTLRYYLLLPPCDGASSAHGSSRCSVWNSSLYYRKKGFTSSVSNGTIGSECLKYRAANDPSVFTINLC